MKKYLLFVLLLTVSAASFRAARAVECVNSSEDRSLDSVTGEMVFYDKCTSIPSGANFNGYQFVSAKFPDGLESIAAETFLGCQWTTSIDLSNTSSLNFIGDRAFYGLAAGSTITVTKGSTAHALLGMKGTDSITGELINSKYGNNSTLIVLEPPTPTPTATSDPLDPTPLPSTPTPTPEPGAAEVIRVVPLPEDEFGSYELDPVTGEKNYLMFNTYAICMDFLNNNELCSGYERCYHK